MIRIRVERNLRQHVAVMVQLLVLSMLEAEADTRSTPWAP